MDELRKVLESTGFPFAYGYFEVEPEIPYVVYEFEENANIFADDIVYGKIYNYRIELYTHKKDEIDQTKANAENEQKLETILNKYGLNWNKREEFLGTTEAKDVFRITYTVEIIENYEN